MRVKRKNSEFKILNSASYKRFKLLSLYVNFTAQQQVNLSLIRSNLVVSSFHHNIALKNLSVITILPSYFSSIGNFEALIQVRRNWKGALLSRFQAPPPPRIYAHGFKSEFKPTGLKYGPIFSMWIHWIRWRR